MASVLQCWWQQVAIEAPIFQELLKLLCEGGAFFVLQAKVYRETHVHILDKSLMAQEGDAKITSPTDHDRFLEHASDALGKLQHFLHFCRIPK